MPYVANAVPVASGGIADRQGCDEPGKVAQAQRTKGSREAPLAIDSPLLEGNGHPKSEPRLNSVLHTIAYVSSGKGFGNHFISFSRT